MTEEHKRKNSESLKKRFGTEYYHNLFSYNSSGENNPMYGHVWTDEQRENARQAALNRDNTNIGKYERTPEINAKMSKALKGKMAGENNPMYGRRGEKSPSYGTHWYNNGEISIKCKERPEGFVKGRLYKFKK